MEMINSDEISKWKQEFGDYPSVLQGLDKLEECNGNLNEAMEIALFQAGYETYRGSSDDWIDWDNILKDFAKVLCDDDFKAAIVAGYWGIAIHLLLKGAPEVLATPIFFYVIRKGINQLCEKLQVETTR